ncbi:uncharacterized protein LOC133864501 isoform X3 [Alnus glutinosa]|uniref:uncharacterized protein LOC133864501 isoform X3 n=1 Tax=Alnus glutinosa TaxID=3517 RepID=UPI002D76B423|nr:uncharacterized protein LOC133864501 isoform X3 [Alnus glutinosa]
MKDNIVVILCKLEKIFPPAFFDIMVHLAVHLPREAELAGPVQYRWMYPVERTLGKYKRFVRNRARPEGSIAECYLSDECLTFCSSYLRGIETRWTREERNVDRWLEERSIGLDVFSQRVRPLGVAKFVTLEEKVFTRARCEHYQKVSGESSLHIEKRHEAEFERWFQNRICGSNAANVSKQLYDLACGPNYLVRSYKGCIVNGVRFHTTECEQTRTTQNSGIVVRGEHGTSNIEFYGVLRNILELRYPGPNHVYLFECDWWNTGIRTGMQTDQYFKTVNTSRTWYESDPFILASQASQVFYLNDIKLGGSWKVVQKMTHRNIYDIPTILERDNEEEDQGVSGEVHQERECVGGNAITVEANNEDSNLL